MSDNEVAGCRILVVEDEMLIALLVEDVLQSIGCEIVGPAATLEKALKLAAEETFDAAILDITIRGGMVYPVAELLLSRGIPFLFASGYSEWALPPALRDKPRLMKPFTAAELREQIELLRSEAGARRPEAAG